MSSAAFPARAMRWLSPVFFGFWAALIALAPGVGAKAALVAPAVLIPLVWWTVHVPARWVAAFFLTALLLPPLPIPIGDSGPHPCLFFAGVGVLAGALWLDEWRVSPSPVNAPMSAVFGILLTSVGAAALFSGPEHAAASLARVALFGISVYV